MKKIVSYSLIALVGLGSACEKQLDQNPISSQATGTFYTSVIEFTQGVNAVYNGLKTYPDRLLNLSETRSDNLYNNLYLQRKIIYNLVRDNNFNFCSILYLSICLIISTTIFKKETQ
jgi:hypothetical protein